MAALASVGSESTLPPRITATATSSSVLSAGALFCFSFPRSLCGLSSTESLSTLVSQGFPERKCLKLLLVASSEGVVLFGDKITPKIDWFYLDVPQNIAVWQSRRHIHRIKSEPTHHRNHQWLARVGWMARKVWMGKEALSVFRAYLPEQHKIPQIISLNDFPFRCE